MLSWLTNLIIACSQSWWKFLLVVALQFGTLMQLTTISAAFPGIAGGNIPFDMQNDLQAEQIFEQLAVYSQTAFDSYFTFQLIDITCDFIRGNTD